jgi:hypothetical protein
MVTGGKSRLFKPLRMQEDTQPILSASTTRRAKLEEYDAVPREDAEKPEDQQTVPWAIRPVRHDP